MSKLRAIPPFSADLIAELEDAYPARCRRLGEDHDEHERYAGARELIERLRVRLDESTADDPYQMTVAP